MTPPGPTRHGTMVGPALTLVVVAPLVAEFLLGNMSIDLLWLLVALAPLYGGGALLIRETTLRRGTGWRGRVTLGFAYGVIEEGVVTQSLFDPGYLGLRLLDYGYLPALGVGAWWTVFVLGLHAVWSTTVPMALAEALWPSRASTPWTSRAGLAGAALLFVAGAAATIVLSGGPRLVASPAQLAGALVVAVALIVRGLTVDDTRRSERGTRPAPPPWRVAGLVWLLLSAFMLATWATGSLPAAVNVAWMLTALAVLAWSLRRWSGRPGWTARHRLWATGGALATYAWWSLMVPATVSRVSPAVDTAGNVAFILLFSVLVAVAARRVSDLTTSTTIPSDTR